MNKSIKAAFSNSVHVIFHHVSCVNAWELQRLVGHTFSQYQWNLDCGNIQFLHMRSSKSETAALCHLRETKLITVPVFLTTRQHGALSFVHFTVSRLYVHLQRIRHQMPRYMNIVFTGERWYGSGQWPFLKRCFFMRIVVFFTTKAMEFTFIITRVLFLW